MTLTVGSLFSGVGGFDLGFTEAGFATTWLCEIDPKCRSMLAHHWPEATLYEDVTTLDPAALARPDVVVGGFPCQDVSVAGRREGLAGERSGLWHEFHRILAGLRPEWVVIENVPGLLSSCGCATCGAMRRLLRVHGYLRRKREIHQPCALCLAAERLLASHRGRDFAVVLSGLVGLGYGVTWRILDAQYFGVAQRRRRLFIVGHLGDGRAAEVLFERDSPPRHPPARKGAGQDAAARSRVGVDVSHSLVAGGNDKHAADRQTYIPVAPRTHRIGASDEYAADDTASCLAARDYKSATDLVVTTILGGETTHVLTGEGADASEDGTGRGTPVVAIRTAQTSSNGHGYSDETAYTLDGAQGQAVAFGISDQAEPKYTKDIVPTLDAKESGTRSYVATVIKGAAIGREPQNGPQYGEILDDGSVYTLNCTETHAVVVPTAYGLRRGHTPKIGKDVTPALTANPNGGNLGAVAYHRNASCAVTAQDDVTAALRAEGEHSYQFIKQKMAVRRLTPKEDERLMGWPDDHTRWGADGAEMSDSTRYKMCGNGVVAPVAAWIARRIAAASR